MSRQRMCTWRAMVVLTAAIMASGLAVATRADITDFHQWTLVEDPQDDNFVSSVDSSSQITLRAIAGPIGGSTDIGYQSINGANVLNSTQGWAFDPAASFSVAVDYDLSFGSPLGGFSIGLGIGEDRDGTNSAGIILASLNGGLLTYGGAARINDVTQTPLLLGAGQSTGRFIVAYDAGVGDVTLGVSTTGDDTPDGATGTFGGIQNAWDDEALMVSFFARGGNGFNSWGAGTADAVFSNFRVLDGTAVAVPEPPSLCLALLGLLSAAGLVRRKRKSL